MTQKKIWEDLQVYHPLRKEDLKSAYTDFTNILAKNLLDDGFVLRGRKLIKQSNDLFHIIHIDTRGSWIGLSDSFKTEISIGSIYDTDTFLLNQELTASKKIEEVLPKIRNYYRITQEYHLLADFLTRTIRTYILPYFSQYASSKDILNNHIAFKVDSITDAIDRNANLILYCELANCTILKSVEILTERKRRRLNIDPKPIHQTELLLELLQNTQWEEIERLLNENKGKILKKLKLETKKPTK